MGGEEPYEAVDGAGQVAGPGVLGDEQDVRAVGVERAVGDDAGAFEGVVGDAVVGQQGDAEARGDDRFAGVAWRATPDGCVLIEGAAAWFDCTVEQQVRSGDYDIVVFRVRDLDAAVEVAPLVFHASGFRRLG
ncbi:MAG: flavin reductase family protein [Actinoallomurus sp.]